MNDNPVKSGFSTAIDRGCRDPQGNCFETASRLLSLQLRLAYVQVDGSLVSGSLLRLTLDHEYLSRFGIEGQWPFGKCATAERNEAST
jgi:hypothetical protein